MGKDDRVTADQPTHGEVVDATAEVEDEMRPQPVPVNVYETSNALVIVAALPAVSASDVSIELRPRCLRFWAHLRSAAPREYLVHEWIPAATSARSICPTASAAGWRRRWRTANWPSGCCGASRSRTAR